jgi:hypothetical protein
MSEKKPVSLLLEYKITVEERTICIQTGVICITAFD